MKEETKRKISETLRKRWKENSGFTSNERSIKLSKTLKGRKMSDEWRRKLSESHIGKINKSKGYSIPEERKIRISKSCKENAKVNPNYGMKGKHHSEITREKFSKSMLEQYSNGKRKKPMEGKNHTNYTKDKISNSKIGNVNIPIETRKRISDKLKGSKSHLWKGGITPLNALLRVSSLYKIWRETVFLRDNFTCQNINCEYCNNKIGKKLQAHHIKPFSLFPELRFDINNGITYCKEYHLNSKLLHKEIIKK